MVKHWVHGAIKRPGALTRKAKAAGETVADFSQKHKHDSGRTGDQSRLAVTMRKFKH